MLPNGECFSTNQSTSNRHLHTTRHDTTQYDTMDKETTVTDPATNDTTTVKPKRIIRRRRRKGPETQTPLYDPVVLEKMVQDSGLPLAYSFEIPKTLDRIASLQATHVALQMPEGLLLYACILGDILQSMAKSVTQISVLGDVTYGACCIDDLGAQALGADLLVHYGHSCLVPLQHTVVPCLYIFVEIQIDVPHVTACLHTTLQSQQTTTTKTTTKTHIYLLGTIQFRHAFAHAKQLLQEHGYSVSIPQVKPLSPGEVLGCTSPKLDAHTTDTKAIVCFVADGRFHLESTLISNPHIHTFYRYDPYSRTLTVEEYGHAQMHSLRSSAIVQAKQGQRFGIILGTLGRQGNPAIVQRIRATCDRYHKQHFLMLLSEITPTKLQHFTKVIDVWVQVACPRLSVDWGHCLSDKPVLTPYEFFVCMEETEWKEAYPMDYYSHAGGPWSNYYDENKHRKL